MAKDLKVLWTENSIQDLFAIKEFISQDSPVRAETWVLELFTSGESYRKSIKKISVNF